ncbi:phage major tail tube protein [Rhizobium sp. FKY42]|uniref:phage major tail tube protein n=1 Tax=Rhizobium sp. FKY42 TaxID=2562310 RepID=UPI0010C0FFCE|nr:phage major tail tube protein [Rhizobium sp. FKY42]
MAQKSSLIMTMVDFRPSTAAEDSRSTILQKVVLGALKYKTVPHSSGGGVLDVEFFFPKLEAIQLGIMVNGFDKDLMPGLQGSWTFAAAMRNNKGKRVSVRMDVEGVITEWTPDDAAPGDFKGCNSSIKQIEHLELHVDGEEWFYADNREGIIRVNGVDITAEDRAAIGIS